MRTRSLVIGGIVGAIAISTTSVFAKDSKMPETISLQGRIVQLRGEREFAIKVESSTDSISKHVVGRTIRVRLKLSTVILWVGDDELRVGGFVWVTGYRDQSESGRTIVIDATEIQLENGTLTKTF
jgi:hypothetical protein